MFYELDCFSVFCVLENNMELTQLTDPYDYQSADTMLVNRFLEEILS